MKTLTKTKLRIFARKNSVSIRQNWNKQQIINAIIEAKKNGTLTDRGF